MLPYKQLEEPRQPEARKLPDPLKVEWEDNVNSSLLRRIRQGAEKMHNLLCKRRHLFGYPKQADRGRRMPFPLPY